MSPTYKWATLHLGDRSMTFSPYTLSGHGFRGFGTELKPGKLSISAMYGKLQRAEAEDLNSLQNIDPLYKRMGWGLKAGYDTGTDHIYAIIFKAWDDINSLPTEDNQNGLEPADNTTISLQGKKELTKVISFSVDYALSAFTRDTRTDNSTEGSALKNMFGLFQPHSNSEYLNAIKSSLGFKLDWGELSLNHEWVEPGYRTLGALFFNNDFENVTVGTKTNFFDKKLNLDSNFGLERNNLRKLEANTSIRFVGSLNANLMLGEKLNINATYSNFKNTSKQNAFVQTQLLVDSIILAQVNQSASLNTSYVAGKEKNSTIAAMVSFSQANSIQNDEVQSDQANTNYVASLSYSYVFTESKLTLSTALFANQNITALQNSTSYSPSLNIKMPFFEDKLTATNSLSYILVYIDDLYDNSIFNWQAGFNYKYKEKHNFGLNFSIVHQASKVIPENVEPNVEPNNMLESIGQLNYSWSF